MPITTVIPALDRTSATFKADVDTFFGTDLPSFATEANALEVNVNAREVSTNTRAAAAAASETNAATSAASANISAANAAAATNAPKWVSGTTYTAGHVVYSPISNYTYRRVIAGAGTTDPSADATNWYPLALEIATGLPTLRPSLNLDFANSKQLDPRVTFTRATTASHTGADGIVRLAAINAPRFDHDAVTGECKGLLIEEQRTNLLTYSEQFDNAAWTKTRCSITANATTAPNSTLTADKLVENTETGAHYTTQSSSFISDTTYTYSAFCKANERGYALIETHVSVFGSSNRAIFALDGSNKITILTGSFISASIISVGGGWYRVSVTLTATVTTTAIGLLLGITSTTASQAYTGDGTSGIYIWGAQLEAGSFATSYIPTTAAATSRSADVAYMDGTNFSGWYNQSEGTLCVDYTLVAKSANIGVVMLSNDSANLIRQRYSSGGAAQFSVISNTIEQATLAPSGFSSPGDYKRAVAFNTNSFQQAINGQLPNLDDELGTVPIVNSLTIGSGFGSDFICGHISRLVYYPKRLSNNELRGLTA
jgi:hypothetical protein